MENEQRGNTVGPEWDWARFEEWMTRAFPFLKDDLRLGNMMHVPFPVGKMVQDALDRAFVSVAAARKPAVPGMSRIELFETHRHLIARILLPGGVKSSQVRTRIGSHRLRVEWPPDVRREVPLNKPVNPRRARAAVKNGILEVRMPKREETFYEL
jgi:HSP20 family molecular chaperone IbpA